MANLALQPGIHPNISEKDYHADNLCEEPTLSRSLACRLVDDSPFHAWSAHPRLNPAYQAVDDSNDAMDFGQLAHKMLLGKGAEIAVLESESWRGKDAAAFWDMAKLAGKIPALRKVVNRAKEMVKVADKKIAEYGLADDWMNAQPEVVLVFRDGKVLCRAMLDRVFIDRERGRAHIFDIKCGVTNPTSLPKHIINQSYHAQDYFYTRGIEILVPEVVGRIEFTFIHIETEDPYDVVPSRLNGEFKMLGLSKMMRAILLWEKCRAENHWPSYTNAIVKLEPPPWALQAEFGAKSFP